MIRRFKDSDFERLIGEITDLQTMQAILLGLSASTTPHVVATNIPFFNAISADGNTLTANANGAFPTQDSGTNVTAGSLSGNDLFLMPQGVLTTATITDVLSGVWKLTQQGSASTPWIATRAPGFRAGQTIKTGTNLRIGAGSQWQATEWFFDNSTAPIVINVTTGFGLYPRKITVQRTLVAGALSAPITSIPIRSASASNVTAERVTAGGTVTTTIQYAPCVAAGTSSSISPSPAVGTASFQVNAMVAAGTSVNASDTSVVNITVTN